MTASKSKAIIIMGSSSDMKHAEDIRSRLRDWGIETDVRVASAHKSPAYLLEMLAGYERQPGARVYITVAGRSNALSGLVDANVTAPVIACPPYSDSFAGADVFSSIRMPSGVSPMLVLDPGNAALAAARILGLVDRSLAEKVKNLQREYRDKIISDDQRVSQS